MAVPAGTDGAVPYVEVSCVDGRCERRRRPLLDCVSVRFEDAVPVRPFRWPGGRHFHPELSSGYIAVFTRAG
ncbi:hypothetical protein AV521_39770 [Streptomyces sp. IMTB 2501]|nr:hypothetical protein AV521_39770 [Streptomyces sp. IMTB 2501]